VDERVEGRGGEGAGRLCETESERNEKCSVRVNL
jgi:hypothetical protein